MDSYDAFKHKFRKVFKIENFVCSVCFKLALPFCFLDCIGSRVNITKLPIQFVSRKSNDKRKNLPLQWNLSPELLQVIINRTFVYLRHPQCRLNWNAGSLVCQYRYFSTRTSPSRSMPAPSFRGSCTAALGSPMKTTIC